MYRIIAFFFICSFFSSCKNDNERRFNISDLDQSFIDTAKFDIPKGDFADKIEISIKGHLTDTAFFNSYFLLPGEVDTTFRHDWYSPSYIIRCKSENSFPKDYLKVKIKLISF